MAGDPDDPLDDAHETSAAHAVVERGKQGARWAGGQLRRRWQEFRAESPYFQAKVGLAVAYALVVVLTVLLAPPSPEPWRVAQKRLAFGLSFQTAVDVENVDGGNQDELVVEVKGKGIEFDGRAIPGVWRSRPTSLSEGDKKTFVTQLLYDDDNNNPPYSLVVDHIRLLDGKDVLWEGAPPLPPDDRRGAPH